MIKEIVKMVGAGNILVKMPITPNGPVNNCKIDESRYPVNEGYKITLVDTTDNQIKDHFYQSDLDMLIRNGDADLSIQFKRPSRRLENLWRTIS